MVCRYPILLCALLGLFPQITDAEPAVIPIERAIANARKDVGDGVCATAVHVEKSEGAQAPFSSVQDALDALNRSSQGFIELGRVSTSYPSINFRNGDPAAQGDFAGGILFPFSSNEGAASPGDDHNFAIRLRGYLNVDAADVSQLQRTLGIYADDGARLSIGGILITTPDIEERLNARRIIPVTYGGKGLYPFELIYYQNGSGATLELSQSDKQLPEGIRLTSLSDLGFNLVAGPRGNLFANSELYTARGKGSSTCIECSEDRACGLGSYCAKDFGPLPPQGLCQQCNVSEHCGASCEACAKTAPICYKGSCVACLYDSDCAGEGGCDLTTHACRGLPGKPGEDLAYVGGCSMAQSQSRKLRGVFESATVLVVVLLLLLLRRRKFRAQDSAGKGALPAIGIAASGGAPILFALLAAYPQTASAQISANVETFRPALSPESLITVEGSRVGKPLRPLLSLLFEYAHRPLRLIDLNSGQTLANTVPYLSSLHVLGGMVFTPRFSLGVDVPVVLYQGFDLNTPPEDVLNTPVPYGLGDVRLVGKLTLIKNDGGGFGMALAPQLTFPTGNGLELRGSDAYTIEPRLVLDYRGKDGALVAFNVGFLGQSQNQIVRAMEVGSQVRYGLGAYLPLLANFGLLAEVAGGTSITQVPNGLIYSPLEGHLGLRFADASGLNLSIGGGGGFTDAIGSPQYRLFASIGYLPIDRKRPSPVPTPVPIPPPANRAALLVEKRGSGTGLVYSYPSGIECGQSCIAAFRMGTRVVLKALPAKQSILVGWSGPCSGTEDCVLTVKGPTRVGVEFSRQEEKYGNVTIEKDGDGTGSVVSEPAGLNCGKICDARFPSGQEVRIRATADKDSRFAGWAGPCSGIEPCHLEVRGDSRLKARFIKSQVVVTQSKLDLQGNVIHFETASAVIAVDSYRLLDEIVVILKQYPQMRLRIEGHADSVPFRALGGNLQLSRERAMSVVRYLVEHGILATRLSSEGFGDNCPVDTNRTREGRQANRRTEFLIVDPVTGQYQRTPCVAWTAAFGASAEQKQQTSQVKTRKAQKIPSQQRQPAKPRHPAQQQQQR